MTPLFERLLRETDGQDLIEYALLASIVAAVIYVGIIGIRDALQNQFTAVSSTLGS
jgi:Flp pilus assembly pilin Flp